jgi:mRNA deadenylase 3'-5' endonuclease subunit Ccr4
MLLTFCFGSIFIILVLFLYNNWRKLFSTESEKTRPIISDTNELVYTDVDPNGKETISILTYNILCQKYIKRANRRQLTLENRLNTIMIEIKSLNPDIICLQEVNSENLKRFFIPNFKEYNFHYSENYGSNFINVTGYKKDKYGLVEQYGLVLNNIDVNGNRGVFFLKLKNKKTNTPTSVYNVHFPWRPIYELEKCYVLNSIIENVLKDEIKNIIIAGDFNSIPNSLVLRFVYFNQFMKELKLYEASANNASLLMCLESIKANNNILQGMRRRKAERYVLENCIKNIFNNESHLQRFSDVLNNMQRANKNFGFKSSYEYHHNISDIKEENRFFLDYINTHPRYTNYTEGFKNTIDYIIHSESFKVYKVLKIPNEFEVSREDYLPSSKYPSDHLKLYTEFIIE